MPFSSAEESGNLEPRLGRSVSIDHAAQLLGVSRRTIYNRIKEGRLATLRTRTGSQRVLLESLQQFVLHQPALVSQRALCSRV
jgi:excisionase family DNA binding protein